ncbi:STAS domain-containing protein [Amycolatopsis sp. NPDC050768]|uniref:STAS domain-containing protein n=1 Tax=Amycolatopsis sp. NPDC050768 TaxID=3154839 RepID=UPI0034042E5B
MTGPFPHSAATFTVTGNLDSTVFAATGDLDCTVADHLHGRLLAEITLRPRALIVDLTRVGFCSARALRALLAASAEAHAAGIPCVTVSDQQAVRRPITLLKLDHVLLLHENLAAAREWLTVSHGVADVAGHR